MRSVNRIALLGRLISPEHRGSVCNFVVETIEEWRGKNGPERRVVHHHCVAFGPIAETMRGVHEGGFVYVEGSMRGDRESDTPDAYEVVCFVAIAVAEPERVREPTSDISRMVAIDLNPKATA